MPYGVAGRVTASARTPEPVLLLDRAAVASVLSIEDCIAAVEAAFIAHARGLSLSPQLMHVDAEGGEFHIKAGGLKPGRAYFACKVNGGFFANRAGSGLPNIIGLILLCDASNGTPLAVMESGHVTQLRTGAATAVAARQLARADSRSLLLCGAGRQAEIQLRSLASVLPLERVSVWSRGDVSSFVQRLSGETGIDVHAAGDLATTAHASDIIVTCTSATSPFLEDAHVAAGTFIAAVGADSPGKQELSSHLVARCSIVCDLIEQCAAVGELRHALAARLMTREQVRGELGDVLVGSARKRVNDDERIIFDSTGTALQDVAAAAAVYERACERSIGQPFDFWK